MYHQRYSALVIFLKKKKKKKRKKTLHLFVSLALLILRVRARREIMAPGVPSGDCGNWG